jgi:hypothetical protein
VILLEFIWRTRAILNEICFQELATRVCAVYLTVCNAAVHGREGEVRFLGQRGNLSKTSGLSKFFRAVFAILSGAIILPIIIDLIEV